MTIEQLLNWMRDNNATLSITKEDRESEGFSRVGNVMRLKVEIMDSDGNLRTCGINRIVSNYEWENTKLGDAGSVPMRLENMMMEIDMREIEETEQMPTIE